MAFDIILGPPGTGKTTTLIERVNSALERGVPSGKIGFFSFTRKAAQEAMERACERFNLTTKDFPHFSTLHSMCYRHLGVKRGDVLEGAKLNEFSRFAGVRISGRWSEDGTMTGFDVGDRILFMENLSRIRGLPLRQVYDEDDDGLPWNEVKRVAAALAEFKRGRGLVDFTDMLHNFVESGIRLGLTELMIDESQDLSHLQWQVVQILAEGCEKVAVAGDDDQAIYRWAGADVDQLIDMAGNVTVLGQSYRVPPVIQQVAHEIISPIRHRRQKKWSARAGEDGVVDYQKEFGNVDCGAGQVLVLARNVYVLREQVEPVLRDQGIIYEMHGHSSISLALMEVVQNWERLRQGDVITVAEAKKIYARMRSGVGYKRGSKLIPGLEDDQEVGLSELMSECGLLVDSPWYEALTNLPVDEVGYIRRARARGEKLGARPRVLLSTIHGAKGGQADHVVILKEIAMRTWREMDKNPEDERRVWYVAVTRARQKLTVVEAQTTRRCPWL